MFAAADVPLLVPLKVAERGQDVTLTCSLAAQDQSSFVFWHKLDLGFQLQTVASGPIFNIQLDGAFSSSRFSVSKVALLHSLHISNLSRADAGTFLCQAGTVYALSFITGAVLLVEGDVLSAPSNHSCPSSHLSASPQTLGRKRPLCSVPSSTTVEPGSSKCCGCGPVLIRTWRTN